MKKKLKKLSLKKLREMLRDREPVQYKPGYEKAILKQYETR